MNDTALLNELTEVAERLTARHYETCKPWYPHEFVPWSMGRDLSPASRGTPMRSRFPNRCAARSSSICSPRTTFRTTSRPSTACSGARASGAMVPPLDRRRGTSLDCPARLHDGHADARPADARRWAHVADVGRAGSRSGVGRRRLRVRRAAGAGHSDCPPQHRSSIARATAGPPRGRGRLRTDQPCRRRRELPLPLLPRPHLCSAGDRAVLVVPAIERQVREFEMPGTGLPASSAMLRPSPMPASTTFCWCCSRLYRPALAIACA